MQARVLVTIIKNGVVFADTTEYLLNGKTTIGRNKTCDIWVADLSLASRCHATIARTSRKKDTGYPKYTIIDGCIRDGKSKKSVNGIKVNGVKVDSAELMCGDRITIVDGVTSTGDNEFCEITFLVDEVKPKTDDTFGGKEK
jgi:pSer/pThr/pTyr-binding forkhead associated (FHA) protein